MFPSCRAISIILVVVVVWGVGIFVQPVSCKLVYLLRVQSSKDIDIWIAWQGRRVFYSCQLR